MISRSEAMLSVTPMLQIQRDLFAIPRSDRFNRYLAVMTGRTNDYVLPLQAVLLRNEALIRITPI